MKNEKNYRYYLIDYYLLGELFLALHKIPFGIPKTKVGEYYIDKGREETGAANIVTSVVVNYRGFDTLGEVTILFWQQLDWELFCRTSRKKEKGKLNWPV